MDATDMTCRDLVELVTDYLEDELTPADRARFERHLSNCEGCRAYLQHMRATMRIVGTLSQDSIPSPMRQRLLEAFRGYRRGRGTEA